jgi:hypothetical protein
MSNIIKEYFENKQLDNTILEPINEILNESSDTKRRKLIRRFYIEIDDFDSYKPLYKIILCLKLKQKEMREKLEKRIDIIKKHLLNKKYKNIRFKWQIMCKVLAKTTDLETLKELAIIEEIPNSSLMTKRQLCKAFSEKLQNIIDQSKDIENCINKESMLSGENITEIQPEFFIKYEHRNKTYCDDVRLMKKQIDENDGKHPLLREKLNDNTINSINTVFNRLQRTTFTMDDFDEQHIELTPESNLQSQMTNLVLKTRDNGYINDQQLFIECNHKQFKKFINNLLSEYLLTKNDIKAILQFNSLVTQKTKLVQILYLKIQEDPNRSGNISEFANNLVNVYNNTFFKL